MQRISLVTLAEQQVQLETHGSIDSATGLLVTVLDLCSCWCRTRHIWLVTTGWQLHNYCVTGTAGSQLAGLTTFRELLEAQQALHADSLHRRQVSRRLLLHT